MRRHKPPRPHGLHSPKRGEAQREADRAEIAALYCKGKTYREIAAIISAARPYNITYRTIGRDVDVILDRWRESAKEDMGRHVAKELARINRIEREAWEAWDRSKTRRERTITERTGHGDKARLEQETQCGDPRYLDHIQWCIEMRCKLLGLIVGKLSITDPAGTGPCTLRVVYDSDGA